MRFTSVAGSSNDSVTSVPSAVGSSEYPQVLAVAPPSPATLNANSRSGSAAVTVQVVQYTGPRPLRRTWPRKRAPGRGPVAPSSHSASNVSGLNSPIRVTSLTRSQTRSAGAAMRTVTEPFTR
jgi:hypothetical protein